MALPECVANEASHLAEQEGNYSSDQTVKNSAAAVQGAPKITYGYNQITTTRHFISFPCNQTQHQKNIYEFFKNFAASKRRKIVGI